MGRRRRSGAVAVVAAAFVALVPGAVPASAQTPGPSGPIVTHPVQEPVDYPAGEVCAFPTHADFPVSDLTLRTWVDRSGNPVFAVESGPLVMRVTNLATGRSVERNISGTGTITYPDPNSLVLSGNHWSAGFHTSDEPVHNEWIVASGYMSVKVTTIDGHTTRTLLALRGPFEDLCKTLS